MSAIVEALLREAYDYTGRAQSKLEEAMLYPLTTDVVNALSVIHKSAVMVRADLLILIPKVRSEEG